MEIVTGDRYLESLVKFVERQAGTLIDGTLVLKLNPVGLHYVQSRLESLSELETLLAGAPVDYLRAYVSDLGDHRALEQLRRILRLLPSLKVISVLPPPCRDPTPLSLLPFGRLKVLEIRGCDLSTSAARGLLELRHTLEKIICHNSTDALRHVFASRIAEIEDSPQWKRLSFVSCAYNCLVLMDESLRLLPVVETLDLSRNKFAKVDNLRRCTKLKLLDLGFNHLRSIATFSKVSCQITKLILRNNALTTLHGIESLKSLEGLDLSYNIISNFSEMELLAGLPSLKSLWLEGNPLCSANWYRAQVYSFFPDPDKLMLDDKNICTREVWKRQIIIASRHKQPAGFGFYSPAKDEAETEGTMNTKRKRLSRVASIESEAQSTIICSDNNSVSCDNETPNKQENDDSDDGAEIVDFINKIEFMKKERSVLWLDELKQWMNHISEGPIDNDVHGQLGLPLLGKETNVKKRGKPKQVGETSRDASDFVPVSGDENNTNVIESDMSSIDISIKTGSQRYSERNGEAASEFVMGHVDKDVPIIGPVQENLKSYYYEGVKPYKDRNSSIKVAVPGVEKMTAKNYVSTLDTIDDVIESRSSSACAGSPPHYQEDILHRRHNLEEEFLQLSAESYSIASSDSNTSDSGDDGVEVGSTIASQSMNDDISNSVDSHSPLDHYEDLYFDKRRDRLLLTENGSHAECNSGTTEFRDSETFPQLSSSSSPATRHVGEDVHVAMEDKKKLSKRKPKKRAVSLSEEPDIGAVTESSQNLNGSLHVSIDVESAEEGQVPMDVC